MAATTFKTVQHMLAGRVQHHRQKIAHDSFKQIHSHDVNVVHIKREAGRRFDHHRLREQLQALPFSTHKVSWHMTSVIF